MEPRDAIMVKEEKIASKGENTRKSRKVHKEDSNLKRRRKNREGWSDEMIERRKAMHQKLLKKRRTLTARIEYNDPALKLHEIFRPPWKRDYTVEENYQFASVHGFPILYLVVCKQCKTVHIQDKSNYNNLLRHLDKHNIEAGRPRKCKMYPTGKRCSIYQAPTFMQGATSNALQATIDSNPREKADDDPTSEDELRPLYIVEDEEKPPINADHSILIVS